MYSWPFHLFGVTLADWDLRHRRSRPGSWNRTGLNLRYSYASSRIRGVLTHLPVIGRQLSRDLYATPTCHPITAQGHAHLAEIGSKSHAH